MSLKVHTRTPFINTNLWVILAKIHAKTVYMATESWKQPVCPSL